MPTVQPTPLPESALLQAYTAGGHTDCYQTVTGGTVTLARFVQAFYTSRLFRAERAVLTLAGFPGTDLQASHLASGTASTFAAWRVEARTADQLLLADVSARTRSWFMVVPQPGGPQTHTLLYFGSAVTAVPNPKTGTATMGPVFRMLLGVHKLYSRALLASAARRLQRLGG